MLLSGEEQFMDRGRPTGYTVRDFWSFQYSSLAHDPEYVAEFLVAKALGKDEPDNRETWTLYDIDYEGLRIEVKETSWWHPANEPGRLSSRRSFGIAIPRSKGERQCDVYVFCLLTGTDPESANPLVVDHWRFYVVPRSRVDDEFRNQKSVSLSRVQAIADEVSWRELRERIDRMRGGVEQA
jgi:hypothetical protein